MRLQYALEATGSLAASEKKKVGSRALSEAGRHWEYPPTRSCGASQVHKPKRAHLTTNISSRHLTTAARLVQCCGSTAYKQLELFLYSSRGIRAKIIVDVSGPKAKVGQ